MKKKLLLSIIIVLIVATSLLPNFMPKVFAGNTVSNVKNNMKHETAIDVMQAEPTIVTDNNGLLSSIGKTNQNESKGMVSLIVKFIIKAFAIPIPFAIQFIMILVATPENESYIKGSTSPNSDVQKWFENAKINWFTIQKAVFGKVPLFNVDFFDVQTSGSSVNSNFKTAIASWFKTTYTIAQVLSLIVLIYIGIRMAMATNPEEKVNYKKMLKNWITSFVILFLLRYVIVILLEIANWLLTLIPESISGKNFESEIINKMFRLDDTESAWTTLIYALSYVIIVGYEVYFFIKYFKRILVMGFLVIVSPLITVTYAIDKADDGKAQAFETWRKMFISNTFMQPIHALLYTIFIYSASEIALKAPLIAVVFFMGILKGEDIFNKLFNLQKT